MIQHRFLLLAFIMLLQQSSYAGFFDERYRGWYWFEENEEAKQKKEEEDYFTMQNPPEITDPVEAERLLKQLQQEIEQAKTLMIVSPTVRNVRNYMRTEDKMVALASRGEDTWREVLYKHPELLKRAERPMNVAAIKYKRQAQVEVDDRAIREFANRHDLILVMDSRCGLCKEYAPVLNRFAKAYGFRVEALSVDGGKSEYFKTTHNPELIRAMGDMPMPTTLAMIRGVPVKILEGWASIAELKEMTLMAIKYHEKEK